MQLGNSQTRQQFFDGSKLIFTIVMGLMFFFYNTDTIIDPTLVQPTIITAEPIHNTPENNISDTLEVQSEIVSIPSLKDLLSGFNPSSGTDYQSIYNHLCQSYTSLCSNIQLQFSTLDHKDQYYALLTLLTVDEINHLLLTPNTLQSTIILKSDPDQKKRGYATAKSIVINVYSLTIQEFFEVLVHELGHILDLGVIQGTSKNLNTKYTEFGETKFSEDDPSINYYALSRESEGLKRGGSSVDDFCTIYGSQNPFEDFSECFNLYINHHNYFLSLIDSNSLLKKKYQFIQSWVRTTPVYKSYTHTYKNDPSYRERDSTKISRSEIKISEV